MFCRVRILALLASLLALLTVSSRAEQVVFSEVMYHPSAGEAEFIEIENLTSTPFDIAEWRLSAGVDYTFPEFNSSAPTASFLKAFERIVVCEIDPATFRNLYMLDDSVRIFGPWTGALSNGGERITLKDKNNVTKCSLRYDDKDLWPVAPDGTGHSLVFTEDSRAMDDYRWWASSANRGGSPGTGNLPTTPRDADLTLNEVQFNTDGHLEWVELYNPSKSTIDATGYSLSQSRELTNRTPLGGNLAPNAHASWSIDVRPQEVPTHLYLIDPKDNVVDAIHLRRSIDAIAFAAYPDGSREFFTTDAISRDQANNPDRVTDIVINELMVEPPTGDREGEFIEIHNRGPQTLDISDWQFDQGVTYTFPPGTSLDAGAYIAIAASAEDLISAHPEARILGDYEGSLANSGEFLRLVDAAGNPADALHYHTGGDWPQLAAGQGSSLELRHPSMDNASPSAWQDSDETTKSAFQTFSFTEDYLDIDSGGLENESDYEELHLHAVGDAHLVLRNMDLRVVGSGGGDVLPNGGSVVVTNGDAATGWLCQGSHHGSFAQAGEFHLVSTGRGDAKANRCEIDITEVSQGDTLTFTFEARWLSGKPTLIAQTWDRTFGDIIRIPVPTNLGTPGEPNSAPLTGPVPTVSSLRHDPAVPSSSDPVRVSASIQGATQASVWHRLDSASGDAPWEMTPMTNVTGHLYTAILTDYQTDGAIVEFYVAANNASGTSELPRSAGERPAMWIVDNNAPPTDLRTQRFILSARSVSASSTKGGKDTFDYHLPRISNQYFNATFISNEQDVIYNCEFRKSGSPWTRREEADFSRAKWKTPGDRRFRGYSKRSLDNDINSPFRPYHNRLTRYWLYLLGHPASENEFIRVVINQDAPILREDVEPVANDFLKRNWKDGHLGELYRIDDEWLFKDDWDFLSGNATWAYKDTDEPERYHTEWMKRSRETEYDYSSFISWVRTLDEDTFTQAQMEALADIDLMAANAAVRGWIDDWDTLTRGRGKNGYFYRRATDDRWMLLQWDSDGAFRDSDAPFLGSLEGIPTFFNKPYVQQRFKLYLGELADYYTVDSPRLAAWFQCEEEASNAYETISDFYNNWNGERSLFAREEIGSGLLTPLETDTSNTTVTSSLVTLTGTSPYNAFSIRIQDHPEAVTQFSSPTTWKISNIALEPGENPLLIEAIDHRGNSLATNEVIITNLGEAQPSAAQHSLRITEVMYHPTIPELEFLEIANTSSSELNLKGIAFDAMRPFSSFVFDAIALAPGEIGLLVANWGGLLFVASLFSVLL